MNHHHQNHYNVVLSVNGRDTDLTQQQSHTFFNECERRSRNRTRMQRIRHSSREMQKNSRYAEKRKELLRKKYQEDREFREEKLKLSSVRYLKDEKYQASARLQSKQRYHNDIEYQNKAKNRSKKTSHDKYTTDQEHRENEKKRNIDKYKTDQYYKESFKRKSLERYASNEQHRADVKMRSIQKYKLNAEHRENVKAKSKQKYMSDEEHRIRVNTASTERYRENQNLRETKLNAAAKRYKEDELFRSKRKLSSRNQYNSDPKVKAQKNERVQNHRIAKQTKLGTNEEVVRAFKEKAKLGIDYSCCCCDRLLFQNQVQRCERNLYAKNQKAKDVADLCIQDKYCHTCTESCPQNCIKSKLWICYTCHRKILNGNVPAESAANKMTLEDIPKELKQLNSLERHLTAIHIPFMKVIALPHGGQQNIHGPVVCVPSDLRKVTSLPMKPEDDLLLRVKLKRKLNYKGYVEYQFVNPKHISEALDFLKQNNQWYGNLTIDTNWNETFDNCQEMSETVDIASEDDEQQGIATDTCLQPVDIAQEVLDHYFDDIYDIAPGEGKNPVRMLQEQGNEAKTFPYHFPSGRFSWNDNRDTRITLSRYFNNRLMNTDDRFAKDSSYIFFSQYMSDFN